MQDHPLSYQSNPAQERCDKAAYELRLMLGTKIVDYGKILSILESKDS
jgi:hypothetical protein